MAQIKSDAAYGAAMKRIDELVNDSTLHMRRKLEQSKKIKAAST